MKRLIPLVLLVISITPLAAQTTSSEAASEEPETVLLQAIDTNLSDFLWLNRPVVVFADSPNDPAFIEQMALLTSRTRALEERDVVLITDTDPDARSDIRLKLRPRGFMLALLGKDGQVKLRKPLPWDVRELSRVIDKMPMRQREIREGRLSNGG